MERDRDDIRNELLIVRCQRGDRRAFDELIRGWERKLFVYIRKLVPDEETTWQILQEVWLQVVRGIASVREPRTFPVWIYRVARNVVMTYHRGRYAQPQHLVEHAEDIADEDDGDGARSDDAELVHFGLSKLSPAERELLTLFFLEDLGIGEVAEVLGVPPGTVKSRLHAAKKSLRNILDREGGRHG